MSFSDRTRICIHNVNCFLPTATISRWWSIQMNWIGKLITVTSLPNIPVIFSGCPVPNSNKSVRVADLYRSQRGFDPFFLLHMNATEQENNFNRAANMYVLWKLGKLSHDRLRVVVFYIWSDLSVSENEIIPRAAILIGTIIFPAILSSCFSVGSVQKLQKFVHLYKTLPRWNAYNIL